MGYKTTRKLMNAKYRANIEDRHDRELLERLHSYGTEDSMAAYLLISKLYVHSDMMRNALQFYASEWTARATATPKEEPTDALIDDAGQRARIALL